MMENNNKIQEWEELSRETSYKKYYREIEKVVFKMPDGSSTDFYIKKEGPVVSVFPLTNEQQVILVKQYRPGPKKILTELPGGRLEKSEKPEDAAARELLEETGYQGNIKSIGTCIDDAYSTMLRYLFVATECVKVAKQKLDKNEYAETALLSIPDFRNLLRSGEMTDVESGYRALDYLGLL